MTNAFVAAGFCVSVDVLVRHVVRQRTWKLDVGSASIGLS